MIDDLLFQSSQENIGYVVTVDFEKAFDSISHEFLFKILKLFGFGQSFCSWVKVLYTDITSCIMNGGYSTGYVNINTRSKTGESY